MFIVQVYELVAGSVFLSVVNNACSLYRCETAGEPGIRGGRAGAGEWGPAGVYYVHLPAVPGEVRSAHGAAPWAAYPQYTGWGLPVLHAPERWGALQQPAHWDAARQAGLCVRLSDVPVSHALCPCMCEWVCEIWVKKSNDDTNGSYWDIYVRTWEGEEKVFLVQNDKAQSVITCQVILMWPF